MIMQSSGGSRREMADLHLDQATSLRAQRSNPSSRVKGEMDCFAALAMTVFFT